MTTVSRRRSGKVSLPRAKAYRETPEVVEGICRMIRSVGKRVAEEDTDGLAQMRALDEAMATAWTTAMAGLRRNYSDREIGAALGVSRQAVEQRWPRPRSTEETS